MAQAPPPGTKPGDSDIAIFRFGEGEEVVCDLNSLTMGERRRAKNELKRIGDDADEVEALVAFLWVVMRRSDPDLDFLDLMEKVTYGALRAAETSREAPAVTDDPEVFAGPISTIGPASLTSTGSNHGTPNG